MADQDRFVRAVHVVERALGRISRERARGVVFLAHSKKRSVTPQQAETLQVIFERGAVSTSSLAVLLGIDPSTASRNLKGLVEGGLVSRDKGLDDGRLTELRLTPKGKRAADAVNAGSLSTLAGVLDRVPRGERQKVTDALELVARAMETDSKA